MLTSVKITWTSYHYISFKKTDILNWNVFFIAKCVPSRVFRGFEQLSSSIWRRVIAWGEMPPRVVFEGAGFWSIFGLWAIIFAPNMLESHSKGSTNADFGLVSKKILSQNNVPMDCGAGPGKGGHKKAKTPPLAAVSPANHKPKTKIDFFRFQAIDLLNPRMVWIVL